MDQRTHREPAKRNSRVISLSGFRGHAALSRSPMAQKPTSIMEFMVRDFKQKIGHGLDAILYPSDGSDGGAAYVSDLAEQVRLDANRRTWFRPHGKSGWRTSVQTGAIVGLILGCLAMILFHDMPSGNSFSNQVAVSVASAANRGPAFTLPAVQVYVLDVGTFANRSQAEKARSRIHDASAVIVSRAGSWHVIDWLAVHSVGLQSRIQTLRKQQIKGTAESWRWDAHAAPGLATLTPSSAADVSRWLAAGASALESLIAVIADHENARDATAAYQQFSSLHPSAAEMAETGSQSLLGAFDTHLNEGIQALTANETTRAMQSALQAYQSLQKLGSPLTGGV